LESKNTGKVQTMKTYMLDADIPEDMQRAASWLRAGEVVGIPTDTIYGLSVNALDSEARERLFKIKNRPLSKKMAMLVENPGQLYDFCPEPEKAAEVLADEFWPGPLTLVVQEPDGGFVGLRCPDSTIARELIRLAGAPLVATSANISDESPALTAKAVMRSFGGQIKAVVDGGEGSLGVPSTVVKVFRGGIEILREGVVSERSIRRLMV
jgi:L-threonylcarbamoyladenylate synthase